MTESHECHCAVANSRRTAKAWSLKLALCFLIGSTTGCPSSPPPPFPPVLARLTPNGTILNLAFTPDGKNLLIAYWPREIQMIDTCTFKKVGSLGLPAFLKTLDISPKGDFLVVVYGDARDVYPRTVPKWTYDEIKIVTLPKLEDAKIFEAEDFVRGCHFSSDGKYLAIAEWVRGLGQIRFLSVPEFETLKVIKGKDPTTEIAAFRDSPRLLVTGPIDYKTGRRPLSAIELDGKFKETSYPDCPSDNASITIPFWTSRRIYSRDHGLRILNFETGEDKRPKNLKYLPPTLAVSDDEKLLVTGSRQSGRAPHSNRLDIIWDLTADKEIARLVDKVRHDEAEKIVIAPDRRMMAIAYRTEIVIYDLKDVLAKEGK